MNLAVVGAGFSGLAAAYDLARAGHQVTLFEAADHVGGLASGFKEPHWDWSLEKYYHHWFASDRHILALIDQLGLTHNLLWPRPYTVMEHRGKFYPFDSILQALRFPGLGWGINKARFGLVGLYLRLTRDWRPLEKVTAAAWMRKWAGEQVYSKMWQPMLEGKFGPHYKQVNMAWLWARLHVRTTRLGTYRGGFQAFADDFAEVLRGMGVQIRLATPVTAIASNPFGGVTVEFDGQAVHHHQGLVTLSPALLAKMAPALPPDYLQGLLNLKSMGALVMTIALKHQLSTQGYYWYNLPKDKGYPFLALVEHTNYLPKEHYGGEHLIYCGDYIDTDHEYFRLTQDELLERFIPALQRINPQFQRGWVRRVWLHRTKYAQPVPLVDHSKHIPAIRTPIPGLYFASMSQVYPWDRGTNFAVEIGRRAAAMMVQDGGNGEITPASS